MLKNQIKSFAKVNIFLKITGQQDTYCTLSSRFVRLENLYDILSFEPENTKNEFNLLGDFSCKLEDNTIYKAFLALRQNCPKIDAYFRIYSVKVIKNIPEFAGLGGGSSNAASFLLLANKVFDLGYSKDRLARIAKQIGADVPFFIYEYSSANVSGIGEIVEVFKEEPLKIETFTPDIKCSTKKVYDCFRQDFYKTISKEQSAKLFSKKSKDILKSLSIAEANDLFAPALSLYPKLKEVEAKLKNQDYYFCGSGSSFFKVL